MRYCEISTPAGRLLLAGDGRGLRRISFQDGPHRLTIPAGWERTETPFGHAIAQLAAYFSGVLRRFEITVALEGTPFQREVRAALTEIPYGETVSYGELTRRLGRPHAARAVGVANGANPIPIVIPCHRVIGTDGSLTGFGGGLPIKRMLLDLEAKSSDRPARRTQRGSSWSKGRLPLFS
jgi:methylated-DNA-[protein]-cysteine S-methyltransferase